MREAPRFLGPSWGRLGGPLGAVLALGSPSWADLGRLGVVLVRLKIDVKIDQKIDVLQDRFWNDFGGFWEGKWSQVGTKMGSKIDVNFERPILQKYI